MELKFFILQNVNPDDYYKTKFPEWNEKSRPNVICPFHGDTKPSLSISLNGGGAKCHASSCGISIGNIVHFESMLAGDIPEEMAARSIYERFCSPIIKESSLQRFKATLHDPANRKWIEWIIEETGLNEKTITDMGIGLDLSSRRVVIPIPSRFGFTVNLRLYRLRRHRYSAKDKELKILNYIENKGKPNEIRYGSLQLFPWNYLVNYDLAKPIFIMASEKETMLAIQHDMQAICSTNGEGSWNESWTDLLTSFDVVLLFDPDAGGKAAAKKIIASLQTTVNSVKSLTLPFPSEYDGEQRDFDDWILKGNGSSDLVFKLLSETKIEVVESSEEIKITSPKLPEWFSPNLIDINFLRNNVECLNKRSRCKGIIASVSGKSFNIPWKFVVKAGSASTQRIFSMEMDRDLINFIGKSDAQIEMQIKEMLSIEKGMVAVSEYISATEVEIIPMPEIGEDSIYVVQRCYLIGCILEANIPCNFDVIPIATLQTQEKIFIICDFKKLSRTMNTKLFTREELEELTIFHPEKKESVYEKLHSVADYMAENFTNIYRRPDWHIVCLLSWFSPIGFRFPRPSENVQRGWLNTLAIGDTQTGKSQVVQTFQQTFKSGEIVNAENCTYVGLVGGAIKSTGGNLMLRWGRIPLCDKQLVVIEELSGLSIEDISNMSEIRSSGIARLDKGGLVGRTVARTRLICLSNVRPANKNLAQYLSGVRAVQELIGHGEDISRFDFIITLVDYEVDSKIINQPAKDYEEPSELTPNIFQRLNQFAWSLNSEDIEITEAAYLLCLSESERLGQIYHPSTPIFKAGSGRYKIGRIACAVATMQFNWNLQLNKIIVTDKHVEAAVMLLEEIYKKESLGYYEFSKQMYDRDKIKDEELLDELVADIIPADTRAKTFETLLHLTKFNKDELASAASIPIYNADRFIGSMLRERAIRKGDANLWEITKAGEIWMKKYVNETKPKLTKSTKPNKPRLKLEEVFDNI